MHARHVVRVYVKLVKGVHKTRMRTLLVLCKALMVGRKLSVTGLEHSGNSNVTTRHNIKRAESMIGNPNLQ